MNWSVSSSAEISFFDEGLGELAGAAIGPVRGGVRRRFGHDQRPCCKVFQNDGSSGLSKPSQKSLPFAESGPVKSSPLFLRSCTAIVVMPYEKAWRSLSLS